MGGIPSVQLPGPSLSYFRSCAEINTSSGSEVILFNAGKQQNVLRVAPQNCSDPSQGSKFSVRFDKLKAPDPNIVNGIVDFILLEDNKQIINSQIRFGFDENGNYQQILVNVPEGWINSIYPRKYQPNIEIYNPTGTVWLQSLENNLFFFDFFLTNNSSEIKIDFYSIGYYVHIPIDSSIPPNNNCQILSNENNDLTLEIRSQSDAWGLNLTEISAIVTGKKKYPNGYNDKLVGYCDGLPPQITDSIQTTYSFTPNIRKVLKLAGENLLDQTNKINEKYNNVDITENVKNCEFYKRIIFYSAVRYYLGGLSSNGDFSSKWLYSNNYKKFLRNLENSDFYELIVIFTDPCYGYVNFNKYFRACEH